MNHYEVLGIKKTASQKEIRDAYKKLIKKYHPDLYQGDKTFAEKKTQSINVAYEVLSNPESKAKYDEEINPKPTYTTNYTSNTTYNPNNYNNYNYSYNPKNSDYSYENYKKRYSNTTSDFYQRRYTDYHRSKTPSSNYTPNPSKSVSFVEKILNSSMLIRLFFILFIAILYIFTFYTNMLNIGNIYKNTSYNENYNNKKNNNTSTPTYSTPPNSTYNDFNINDYYSDKELFNIYQNYKKIDPNSFNSFAEFKDIFSEYYYYINIDTNGK